MHLNVDPELEADVTEHEAIHLGDYEAQMPFRRHARSWFGGAMANRDGG